MNYCTTAVATDSAPTFRPMVEECAKHGISRTVAFELVAKGLLQSFLLGKRRYVLLDSLRTLPERLTEVAA